MTYGNTSSDEMFSLYNLHSKGQHLKAPLIANEYARWSENKGFAVDFPLEFVQGVQNRRNFHGQNLRGVVVVSRRLKLPSTHAILIKIKISFLD